MLPPVQITARHMRATELYAPHWYGYEVYFGLDDRHRGVLSHLQNELAIRDWLRRNECPSMIEITGHRVTFHNEDDAQRMFEAWR